MRTVITIRKIGRDGVHSLARRRCDDFYASSSETLKQRTQREFRNGTKWMIITDERGTELAGIGDIDGRRVWWTEDRK